MVIRQDPRAPRQVELIHDGADQSLVPDDAPVGVQGERAARIFVIHPSPGGFVVGHLLWDCAELLQALPVLGVPYAIRSEARNAEVLRPRNPFHPRLPIYHEEKPDPWHFCLLRIHS